MLFCFRSFQDCGKRIAKVHGADFFTLCCPYFCSVPCPVVTHTAAYCQILFFKVDVLPSQTTDLSNAQACIIGYLYRKKCRIVFLFQEVL